LFDGEKTVLFWVGLVILGFSSTFFLFNSLWNFYTWGLPPFRMLTYQVPNIVMGIVFMLIGLYMMKSGVKKKEE